MALKVMIVEDDFIIQMFLETAIENYGCEVVGLADNSDDALLAIKEQRPDLIFMDIGISGTADGIETATLINSKYNIPIAFITGNSDEATLTKAKATNPIHIIKKPIDEVKLKKELSIICDKL